MTETSLPQWLRWAREIQALSQTGLTYHNTAYDAQRYTRLLQIAAEIVAEHARLPEEPTFENFRVQPGYATPKIDVRGAIVKDGKILLVQERVDQCWCMPGGWADVGEAPSTMVIREVWEESGLEVVPEKLIGVYDANRGGIPIEFYHAYKLVFLCRITSGEPRPSDETLAADFFAFDDLPPLSSARTGPHHLADIQHHLHDPALPTIFD
ncbi:MAG: NUDIX hydrolase [Ardenticatenaceae bacterium]